MEVQPEEVWEVDDGAGDEKGKAQRWMMSAVAAASASFETYWGDAEEITQDMIDEMVRNSEETEAKKEAKREENRAASSKSVSRSVSRSLSNELEDVKQATRK